MSSTDSATLRPTPGTWKIRTITRGGKPILFIESETPNLDGGPVACLGNAMLPFVQANARLFVAARDLLAACEAYIAAEDGTDLMTSFVGMTRARALMDRAIAKAKGNDE